MNSNLYKHKIFMLALTMVLMPHKNNVNADELRITTQVPFKLEEITTNQIVEESTTESPPPDILVIFGPDNPHFDLIHLTALVCLGISILVSSYTLFYLLKTEKGNVFNWKVGQRLVLYLAVADLLFSMVHFMDHLYWQLQIKSGFEEFCVVAAFFLNSIATSQGILVLITALSAFATVALNKIITYGKYDWILLVLSFGTPAILSGALAGLDLLGPSGFWCHGNMRKESGPTVFTIFSSFTIATFITNIICYIGVWFAIKATTKRINKFKEDNEDSKKYTKTIRILVLFVIAYMAQWWPLIVYTIWSYITIPHIAIVEAVVIFANLGGVFNYGAYTFVRRRSREDQKRSASQSNSSTAASNTNVSVLSSDKV